MLATMTWGQWTLAALITLTCLLLMVVILLQKGRGGGLAGAFGGSGGSSAFGAKTGDVFTWITVIGAGVFVLLTVVGNFAFDLSGTTKPPTAQLFPLDDGTPGEQAGEKSPPASGVKAQLITTDPVTGESKTVDVGGGVPADAAPKKSADDAAAPTTPTAGEGAVTPEPESKPEGSPENKEEEKAPSHP